MEQRWLNDCRKAEQGTHQRGHRGECPEAVDEREGDEADRRAARDDGERATAAEPIVRRAGERFDADAEREERAELEAGDGRGKLLPLDEYVG